MCRIDADHDVIEATHEVRCETKDGATWHVLAECFFQARASELHQENNAIKVARKYSEAVSCQIEHPASVVKLRANDERGVGALYLAYWVGDRGCFGGKGSVFANYALVVQSGYLDVGPVIVGSDGAHYRIPEMSLNKITSVTVTDGYLYVSGIGYGDKDEAGWPATK